jgi:hypothetical protein
MALTDLERKRCEKALAAFFEQRRPPPEIRDEVDLHARIEGQSIEIYETRPDWQDDTRTMETPIAKATLVRTKNRWKIFWMRRDLKWHGYEPYPDARTVEEYLNVVARDEYCCFFG